MKIDDFEKKVPKSLTKNYRLSVSKKLQFSQFYFFELQGEKNYWIGKDFDDAWNCYLMGQQHFQDGIVMGMAPGDY